MKFAVILLLVCVAMASAAPQFITAWNGFTAPGVIPTGAASTIVAGPSVYNGGFGAYGTGFGRFVAPGYVGTYF